MINWNRYSINKIKVMWENFNFARNYPYKCTKKVIKDCHLTCLEREALIDYLLEKLSKG